MIKNLFIISFSLFFVACGGSGGRSTSTTTITTSQFTLNVSAEPAPNTSKIPVVNDTWNIQLQGTVNEAYNVNMYEVDLFDTSTTTINNLKKAGEKVICYFNAGAYENWRSDASDFPSSVLGNTLVGFPNERWLDIRNDDLMAIMEARLNLAQAKGCDGVDPDNMNGYIQDSGFNLSSNDQLAYNRYIANEARKRDLSVALKNDIAQIDQLVDYFDFAVNEECFENNECDSLDRFITDGKAVFNLEYASVFVNNTASARDTMCTNSNAKSFSTLVMAESLDDSFRFSCK